MSTLPTPPRKLGIVRRIINDPRLLWPWLPAIVLLGVPMILAVSFEGRIPNPLKQYLGIFPGDVFLSIAMGEAIWLCIYHLVHSRRQWFRMWQWHAFGAALGVLAAGSFYWFDYQNMVYGTVPEAAYTSGQFYGPTHMFHFALVVGGGYVLGAIVLPVLLYMPRWFWRRKLGIALGLAIWMACVTLDNFRQRPNLADIHGEWFGGWWHVLS